MTMMSKYRESLVAALRSLASDLQGGSLVVLDRGTADVISCAIGIEELYCEYPCIVN